MSGLKRGLEGLETSPDLTKKMKGKGDSDSDDLQKLKNFAKLGGNRVEPYLLYLAKTMLKLFRGNWFPDRDGILKTLKEETDIVARPQDIHSMTQRYDKEWKSTDNPLVLAVSILTQVEREYDEDEKKEKKEKKKKEAAAEKKKEAAAEKKKEKEAAAAAAVAAKEKKKAAAAAAKEEKEEAAPAAKKAANELVVAGILNISARIPPLSPDGPGLTVREVLDLKFPPYTTACANGMVAGLVECLAKPALGDTCGEALIQLKQEAVGSSTLLPHEFGLSYIRMKDLRNGKNMPWRKLCELIFPSAPAEGAYGVNKGKLSKRQSFISDAFENNLTRIDGSPVQLSIGTDQDEAGIDLKGSLWKMNRDSAEYANGVEIEAGLAKLTAEQCGFIKSRHSSTSSTFSMNDLAGQFMDAFPPAPTTQATDTHEMVAVLNLFLAAGKATAAVLRQSSKDKNTKNSILNLTRPQFARTSVVSWPSEILDLAFEDPETRLRVIDGNQLVVNESDPAIHVKILDLIVVGKAAQSGDEYKIDPARPANTRSLMKQGVLCISITKAFMDEFSGVAEDLIPYLKLMREGESHLMKSSFFTLNWKVYRETAYRAVLAFHKEPSSDDEVREAVEEVTDAVRHIFEWTRDVSSFSSLDKYFKEAYKFQGGPDLESEVDKVDQLLRDLNVKWLNDHFWEVVKKVPGLGDVLKIVDWKESISTTEDDSDIDECPACN